MFQTSKENNQLTLSWCQYHIQLNETYEIGKQETIGNELAKLQKFPNVSFISSLHYDCITFENIQFNSKVSIQTISYERSTFYNILFQNRIIRISSVHFEKY